MESHEGPSQWAVDRFGKQYADELWTLVPAAVQAAVGRQIDTHLASGLESMHAYGGAWPAMYEELVNRVGGLHGVEVVRPAGSSVHLVIVNGSLLVPFRYATDLTTPLTDWRVTQRLNKTCRSLLSQFGPEPRPLAEQLPLPEELFPMPAAEVPSILRLLGDARPNSMTLVYFAANANGGLLRIGWGEAALRSDGSIEWVEAEELPVPTTRVDDGQATTPVSVPGRSARPDPMAGRRFDDGPLQDPALSPRPSAEQTTSEPVVEQPPVTPRADDGADDDGQ